MHSRLHGPFAPFISSSVVTVACVISWPQWHHGIDNVAQLPHCTITDSRAEQGSRGMQLARINQAPTDEIRRQQGNGWSRGMEIVMNGGEYVCQGHLQD